MTITLSAVHILYFVVMVLLVVPFIYDARRGHYGTYDFHVDSLFVFIGCWAFAIALIIGRVIGKYL